MTPGIALLLAALCVAANFFFVAAEFALAKVRPSKLEAQAKGGDADAEYALKITRHLDAYLSATQLGITLASLGLGWLGEPALAHLIDPLLQSIGIPETAVHAVAFTLAFSVISLFHIVLGELVPKSLAIMQPAMVARRSARPLRWFYIATRPALAVLNGLSNAVLRALKLPAPAHAEGALSLEEIRVIISKSFGESDSDRKRDLLERVLRGVDRPVRTVMIPRVDMVVLSRSHNVAACLERVKKHGFSRYPLCDDGDADKVMGYVYVKDLLLSSGSPEQNVDELKRDVMFVPESLKVGELLSEFQLQNTHMAIVLDEYGGTSGLVTLEDVVEEVVGEIQDEHDLESPRILTRDDGDVDVHGALPCDELRLPGLELDDVEGADTIGGYVVSVLGRLARRGDRVRIGEWEAQVREVRRRRVQRVRFTRLEQPTSERPPSERPTSE